MRNPLFICLCLFLAGCASMLAPEYSFVFTNSTNALLRNVGCTGTGGFQASAGSMIPGSHKSDELIPNPIPDEVTVVWQTLDGQNHSQRIAIKSQLPSRFRGEVVLTFTPDGNVVLSHQPYFELPR